MHPSSAVPGEKVYECYACGARVEDPSSQECERCGSTLQSLGVPRDL